MLRAWNLYSPPNQQFSFVVHRQHTHQLSTTEPESLLWELCTQISDFGHSQVLPDGSEWVSVDFCGTLSHSSPDYLHHGTLSAAADVYAFGMIMWEMIHGELPYHDHPNKMYALWNKEPLKFTADCPEAYRQLSMKCMDLHREVRYGPQPKFIPASFVLHHCLNVQKCPCTSYKSSVDILVLRRLRGG